MDYGLCDESKAMSIDTIFKVRKDQTTDRGEHVTGRIVQAFLSQESSVDEEAPVCVAHTLSSREIRAMVRNNYVGRHFSQQANILRLG